MQRQTLLLQLNSETATLLENNSQKNLSGQTLDKWLVDKYKIVPQEPVQTTLFSVPVEINIDTWLMLEGLAKITNRTPEELIEEWANDNNLPTEENPADEQNAAVSPEVLEQIAEVLNVAEMFFSRTVADTQQKLGDNYPEGEKVAKTTQDIFSALRQLLNIEIEG